MSGGSPQTTVSQNGPPQVFLDAYGRVVNRAENVAATPYEAYPGQTVAGFSPDQTAAMGVVRGAQGISAPYINQAADYIDQSTAPLLGGVPTLSSDLLGGQAAAGLQNLQQATGTGITDASRAGAQGILDAGWVGGRGITDASRAGGQGILDAGWAGGQGITDASSSFTPQSVAPWMSPYTESVVDATRRQFGHSNEQQRQGVVGNAISRGAWGGDRSAVAEAILAGEQQMSQAPVLAGLMDRGYQSGLGAAQNAAQLRTQGATSAGGLGLQGAMSAGNLGLQGTTAAGNLGLQGATSAAGLGLQGATSDAQQRQTAAAQLLGLFTGQQGFGFDVNKAQAQLAQQAGYGMAGLGREAQSSTLTGAQALAGMGALQQEQAQRQLNVPYQQFMAAQQYPFQTTGWLSNIASGLGGASGGTKTETAPGPNTLSQVAGLGATALGAIGATRGFGDNGWLTNLFPRSSGGGVPYAKGGEIDADYEWLPDAEAPDLTLSIVPGADGMRVIAPGTGRGGVPNILQSSGTTSTTSGGGGGGPMSSILGLAGTVAGGIYGGPVGATLGGMGGRLVGSAFAEGGDVPMVDMVAGTRPGSRIPRLNFGPPGQGLGAGVPQFAPGELPVLQQAVAGLGGNGGVDDYLAGQMKGASFAKPNFYVPPPPPLPAAASPVDAMDAMRAARQAALDWDIFNDNPEGGGNEGAGDSGPGDSGPGNDDPGGNPGGPGDSGAGDDGPGDSGPGGGPEGGPEGSGDSYRSGGIVRRKRGGFTGYEEDMPLPPMPPEGGGFTDYEEDMPLPPMPPEGGGDVATKSPGFMAAGNPWNALMYAGLGTMGGNSPNALTNIGRGAMAGLEQFGKERTTAEALAARRANASALERYRTQTADIAAQRLKMQELKTDADIKRSEAQTNKLVAAVGAAGGGGGRGRAEGTWVEAQEVGDDGKVIPGHKWLPNNDRSKPYFVPGAGGKAAITQQGLNDRATVRADANRDWRKIQEGLQQKGMDLKGQALAQAAFFQSRGLDLKEEEQKAKGPAATASVDKARDDWISRRLGQLNSQMPPFRGNAMEQAIKDYNSLPGRGDAPASAPAAVAKPQPTPEQAAQAIRIAKKAVAGGFPREEAIKRLRASGVTVPDDF